MSFPANPPIGTTFESENGFTYIYTPKKLWKIYSTPNANGANFTVGEQAPDAPAVLDYWFDTIAYVLKIWIHNGIKHQWWPVNGAYDEGEGSDYQSPADRVLPLSWGYTSEGFHFELWGNDSRYSWRDTPPVRVVRGYAGDSTLDVSNSDTLRLGANYVLYAENGLRVEVDVAQIINKTRVRLRNTLQQDILDTDKAWIGRTSFTFEDGHAKVINGDSYYSRPLNVLRDRQNGIIVIRRSALGVGEFTVRYREIGTQPWSVARLLRAETLEADSRDEFYELLKGGIIEINVRYRSTDGGEDTLDHMALFTAPEVTELGRVEKPTNVTPENFAANQSATPTLTGSTYRSLYAIAQGGAEFQIAEDENFYNIAVNSSTSFLAAWVNRPGFTGEVSGLEYFSDGDLAIGCRAGNSVQLLSADEATLNNRSVAMPVYDISITGSLLFVAGASGIQYSSNKGNAWTTANIGGGYTGAFNGIAAAGNNVVAVGVNGEIQRSVNGGPIFSKVLPDNLYTGTFNSVDLLGNGRTIAVGTNGEIQTSTNFGGSFTHREPAGGYRGTWNRVRIRESDGVGFAVGANGEVQKTEDFGSTWRRVFTEAYTGTFYDVAVYGDFVVVVGSGGEIQTSTDVGETFVGRVPAANYNNKFGAVVLRDRYGVIGGVNALQHTLQITGTVGTSYTVPAGSDLLQTNRVYFWRVRYQDAVGYWSNWSEPTSFATSTAFDYVRQPSNLAPAQGATGIPTAPLLQSSSFAYVGNIDTHVASQWEVAPVTGGNFANPVYRSNDTPDLTSHQIPNASALTDRTNYVWRVRHKGASGRYSPWSIPTAFETQLRPAQPVITAPTANEVNTSLTPTLRTNGFSIPSASIAHNSTQWQISRTPSFSEMVLDTGASSSLTEYAVSTGILSSAVVYYVRARHQGTTTDWSAWSEPVRFTTTAVSVRQPIVSLSGVTSVSANAVASVFSVIGNGAVDTYAETQWELRNGPNGTGTVLSTVVTKAADAYRTTFTGLSPKTTYYVRARNRGTAYGYSVWSADAVVNTLDVSIRTPTVTVSAVATTTARLSTNEFVVEGTGTSDSHQTTEWEVWTGVNGTGTRVWTSTTSTPADRLVTTATGLPINTNLYARARFRGAAYGLSGWSADAAFATTVPTGNQDYTAPGSYNFVVPEGVTNIHIKGVGPGADYGSYGGGGGGALSYRNNVGVTPGQAVAITVGTGATSTVVGAFLRANAATDRIGGVASNGNGVVSYAGGDGGDVSGSYGGGGGAAGRPTRVGGNGGGYSVSSRQEQRTETVPAKKSWQTTGYGETGSQPPFDWYRDPPDPTNLSIGSTLTRYGGEGTRNGTKYYRLVYMRVTGTEATTTTRTVTVSDYSNTAPTGIANEGRGGVAGTPGEGVGFVGTRTPADNGYGFGGGRTATKGKPGAVQIVWGAAAAY